MVFSIVRRIWITLHKFIFKSHRDFSIRIIRFRKTTIKNISCTFKHSINMKYFFANFLSLTGVILSMIDFKEIITIMVLVSALLLNIKKYFSKND